MYPCRNPGSSRTMDERNDLWTIRARERLDLLEALSGRLTDLSVPHRVKHHTDNGAPIGPSERTIPALIVGGEWVRVRVLYWDGRPFFVAWDAYTRYSTDEAGVDRLAAVLAMQWRDAKASRSS